jgi:nucleotide-binding universal stress UspA family protein
MKGSAITRPVVLVGVDGSDEGAKAVSWAADYATLSGGVLDLLIAWHWPSSYGYSLPIPGYDPEVASRTLVEKVAAQVLLPPEQLRTTVVGGPPAQRLVEASEYADLLVVGSRGQGGFSGLLLGSVSGHCVRHAHCPVVVVRPADLDRGSTH